MSSVRFIARFRAKTLFIIGHCLLWWRVGMNARQLPIKLMDNVCCQRELGTSHSGWRLDLISQLSYFGLRLAVICFEILAFSFVKWAFVTLNDLDNFELEISDCKKKAVYF